MEEKHTILKYCDHCGAELNEAPIFEEGLSFCCKGCSSVYAILKAGGLCDYYSISEKPGVRTKHENLCSRQEVDLMESHFVVKEIDQTKEILLFIPTMHCSSCIWLLEKLATLDTGIMGSRADFMRKQLRVVYNSTKTTFGKIVNLLKSLGYEPSLLPEKDRDRHTIHKHKEVIKLGVAGFCAGNTMMFSFPQYFGLSAEVHIGFVGLFDTLNVLLSIPVVFYCSREHITALFQWLSKGLLSVKVPLAIGLLALWLRSLYEVLTHSGPGYFDSLCGLVFFLMIGIWLQNRTFDSLRFGEKAIKFFPLVVHTLVNGKRLPVKVADVKVGSRLQLNSNEIIPADSILMSAQAFVDYSFATGESSQIKKVAGEIIYAGGRNSGGTIEVEVVKAFEESLLAEAWNNSGDVKTSKTLRYEKTISLYFIYVTLVVAVITLLYWQLFNPNKDWFPFIAVLMVACPCALALAPPFAYNTIAGFFAKNGFYVKSPGVIGVLGDANTLVFDKTGTITNPEAFSVKIPSCYNDTQKTILHSIAAQSNHPYSRSIASATRGSTIEITEFMEQRGKGISAIWNNKTIKLGSADWVGINKQQESLHKQIWFSIGSNILEPIEVNESALPHKTGTALQKIKALGVKLILSSGDGNKEVLFVNEQLPGVFNKMFSEQTPTMKAKTVIRAQREGTVIMFGDGLNDASALREGDAGVVVTSDTNNFTPEASAILLKNHFVHLPVFIGLARKANKIVKETFIMSLIYNACALSLAASGNMRPVTAAIIMPISSISLMLFAWGRTKYLIKNQNSTL